MLANAGVTGIRVTIDGSAMKMTVQRDRMATEQKHNLFGNSAGTALTLANLELREGASTTEGGAVRSFGDLTIQDCDFSKNKSMIQGGAVYFDGGTLVVNGSDFTFNSAQLGGAISVGGNARFVSIMGTAIHWNTAEFQGGGLYIQGSTSQVTTNVLLSQVTVAHNQAKAFGGGICVATSAGAGTDLTLDNNTLIEQNQLLNPDVEYDTKGGGIYFGKGTIRASSVTIKSNTAKTGDGMYRVTGTVLVGMPTYEDGDTGVTGP